MMNYVFVEEMSEDELLARFLPLLPQASGAVVPSGDDCAVLPMSDGRVAISTDMLVEGVHFRRDSVAMGARPVSLVIGLELPGRLPVSWVEDFARGLDDACAPLGCGVDGGDLVSGDRVTIGVTVLGDLEGRDPLLRRSAQPGEALIHVGNLGRSAAGYELLRRGFSPQVGNYANQETLLIDDFLRTKPPVIQALGAARAQRLHRRFGRPGA